tara:strand:- start:1055 stop:1312 length:258 start_codon:yes stop_codon:yes gene_type:complete
VNPSETPINQYSLKSLELWLRKLGASPDNDDPSKWFLKFSNWEATINFEQEDLSIVWNCEGQITRRMFSYYINRADVENAIMQGP